MRRYILGLAAAFLLIASVITAMQTRKGGEDETGPYVIVDKWMKPFAKSGYIQGSQGGVFAESPNRIFVLNRGELKLPQPYPKVSTERGVRSDSRRRRAHRSCAIAFSSSMEMGK